MSSLLLGLCLALLTVVHCTPTNTNTHPKVEVYSREPGAYGQANVLICRVSQIRYPDIAVELIKDGQVMGNTATELRFTEKWIFHATKNEAFTPRKGEKYGCRVTQGGTSKDYMWEPNM